MTEVKTGHGTSHWTLDWKQSLCKDIWR